MEKYDRLLAAALRDIAATFRQAERRALTRQRGARITPQSQRPEDTRDFELVTWLVITSPQRARETAAGSDG